MASIALATMKDLYDWEVDDEPLIMALEDAGFVVSRPAWDDLEVDWSGFDAVVIRTTWDYTTRRDEFVRWARDVERQTRLLNPASVVEWNTNKRYLRELGAAGVECVPTVWIERGERFDLSEWFGSLRGDESMGFFKPQIGANAQQTCRFSAHTLPEAQRALDELLFEVGVMLQPYRASVETFGEVSVLTFGGQVSHCVRKIPVAGDYRVQDDWGASDEPFDPEPELLARAGAALAAAEQILGVSLFYARADFLRGPSGFELNELELVEPSLFFRHSDAAPGLFAQMLAREL